MTWPLLSTSSFRQADISGLLAYVLVMRNALPFYELIAPDLYSVSLM